MTRSTRDERPPVDSPLARFLERLQRSFSHDLRTPLATIVNYAAVLETTRGADADDVRDLGRRIRGNTQRVASMIQLLAQATALASRPLRAASTDLLVLARSVICDAGGRGGVQLRAGARDSLAEVDAEVVGFAWRSYLAVEGDAHGQAVDEAEVAVAHAGEHVDVSLSCEARQPVMAAGPPEPAQVDLPAFLRHDNGPARLECALGLSLAQDLVACHGGELQVFGRPGSGSVLRLHLRAA